MPFGRSRGSLNPRSGKEPLELVVQGRVGEHRVGRVVRLDPAAGQTKDSGTEVLRNRDPVGELPAQDWGHADWTPSLHHEPGTQVGGRHPVEPVLHARRPLSRSYSSIRGSQSFRWTREQEKKIGRPLSSQPGIRAFPVRRRVDRPDGLDEVEAPVRGRKGEKCGKAIVTSGSSAHIQIDLVLDHPGGQFVKLLRAASRHRTTLVLHSPSPSFPRSPRIKA